MTSPTLTPAEIAALPGPIRAEHEAMLKLQAGEVPKVVPEQTSTKGKDVITLPPPIIDTPVPGTNADVVPKVVVDDPTKGENKNYEAMYKSIKGKYDAEVPKLFAQIRTLKSDILVKEGEITALKEVVQSGPAPTGTSREEALAKLEEDFGEEAVTLMKQLGLGGSNNESLAQQVEDLKQQNTQREAEARISVMESGLDKAFNGSSVNWRQIDNSIEFESWLKTTVEPNSGALQDDCFSNHMRNGNINGLVHVYSTYAGVKPATQPTAPTSNLDAQVIPDSRGTAQQPTTPGQQPTGKIYTRAEYDLEYKRVIALGVNTLEGQKLNDELMDAARTHRVR